MAIRGPCLAYETILLDIFAGNSLLSMILGYVSCANGSLRRSEHHFHRQSCFNGPDSREELEVYYRNYSVKQSEIE